MLQVLKVRGYEKASLAVQQLQTLEKVSLNNMPKFEDDSQRL